MRPIAKIAITVGVVGAIGVIDYYYPEIKKWWEKRSMERKRAIAGKVLDGEMDFKDMVDNGVSMIILNQVKNEREQAEAKAKFESTIKGALENIDRSRTVKE